MWRRREVGHATFSFAERGYRLSFQTSTLFTSKATFETGSSQLDEGCANIAQYVPTGFMSLHFLEALVQGLPLLPFPGSHWKGSQMLQHQVSGISKKGSGNQSLSLANGLVHLVTAIICSSSSKTEMCTCNPPLSSHFQEHSFRTAPFRTAC